MGDTLREYWQGFGKVKTVKRRRAIKSVLASQLHLYATHLQVIPI